MSEIDFDAVRSGFSSKANALLNIPPRYRKLSLRNFDGKVESARIEIAQSRGVHISGPCGVGKTHLAAALLIDWFADALANSAAGMIIGRPTGFFVSAGDLTLEIAESGKRGEAKLLRKYDEFDCLVLDDLGAELSNQRSRAVFSTMVDRRFWRCRRLIITTNLSIEDLSKFYDDRMISRIVGMCYPVKLDGPDRRVVRAPVQQSLAVG